MCLRNKINHYKENISSIDRNEELNTEKILTLIKDFLSSQYRDEEEIKEAIIDISSRITSIHIVENEFYQTFIENLKTLFLANEQLSQTTIQHIFNIFLFYLDELQNNINIFYDEQFLYTLFTLAKTSKRPNRVLYLCLEFIGNITKKIDEEQRVPIFSLISETEFLSYLFILFQKCNNCTFEDQILTLFTVFYSVFFDLFDDINCFQMICDYCIHHNLKNSYDKL